MQAGRTECPELSARWRSGNVFGIALGYLRYSYGNPGPDFASEGCSKVLCCGWDDSRVRGKRCDALPAWSASGARRALSARRSRSAPRLRRSRHQLPGRPPAGRRRRRRRGRRVEQRPQQHPGRGVWSAAVIHGFAWSRRPARHGYLPHIAIAPVGLGLITWQSTPYQSGRVTTIYGRHVSATKGTFGSLLKFTADGAYAQLAVDKAGRSGVIWERSSLGSVIQARFGS
jgi:hypothetical protein